MNISLMKHIVCPNCKSKFVLECSEKGKEIINGKLICEKGHEYFITGGIPRFAHNMADKTEATKDSFSKKWKKVHLDAGSEQDSKQFQLNWKLKRYGFADEKELKSWINDKKLILEAGTGLGRDSELYATNSKGLVFGIDISESIDYAYKRHNKVPNLHLIQADLTHLPFRENYFDLIACDQVIHHTPDTQKSFAYLIKYLSDSGELITYVYKVKGPIREFCDDFIRDKTTEMSFEQCYQFCKKITEIGKSLSELNASIDVPEIKELSIKKGSYDVQRFFYWNVMKCFWNKDYDMERNILVNLDWYHPKIAHRHTPAQVRRWIRNSGLKLLHMDMGDAGISIRVHK